MARKGRDRKIDHPSSGREEEEEKSDASASSHEDAYAALQAHFARSFELPTIKPLPASSRREGKQRLLSKKEAKSSSEGESKTTDSAKIKKSNKANVASESPRPNLKGQPETIVFGGTSTQNTSSNSSSITLETPSNWRKFMSSKISTKTDEEKRANLINSKQKKGKAKQQIGGDDEGDDDDGEEEKQAQSNDRALSELLGSTLFAPGGAGSKTTRSNGRPILGSNDTLARLLELSSPSLDGKAKSQGRGYGHAMLKSQDMAKMPAKIRHGMRKAEVGNQERELQRQKELGNYHHSIKGLLTKKEGMDLLLGTTEKDKAKRKRDKGLGMGVGKFAGGMLKLSDRDIQRINKPSSSGSQKRRRT